MDDRFQIWLAALHPAGTTAGQYLSDLKRIESHYGPLETMDDTALEELLAEFSYSAIDARNGAANPTRLPIQGELYKSLASYRSCIRKYMSWRAEAESAPETLALEEVRETADLAFRYEQDLQTALIACIAQIEPGMRLAENGKEYQVASGRIDALALDAQGGHVVIELKAVTAKREVLGQIAAYMADILDETGTRPRGILIAPEFDAKLISGARMIEGLRLMRYAFAFTFTQVG